MVFNNGLMVAVRWAASSYCERQQFGTDYMADLKETHIKSADAELSIVFDTVMMNWGNDTVLGHVGPDTVAKIMALVQRAEPEAEGLLELRRLGLAPEAHHRESLLESIRVELVKAGMAIEPVGESHEEVYLGELPT